MTTTSSGRVLLSRYYLLQNQSYLLDWVHHVHLVCTMIPYCMNTVSSSSWLERPGPAPKKMDRDRGMGRNAPGGGGGGPWEAVGAKWAVRRGWASDTHSTHKMGKRPCWWSFLLESGSIRWLVGTYSRYLRESRGGGGRRLLERRRTVSKYLQQNWQRQTGSLM